MINVTQLDEVYNIDPQMAMQFEQAFDSHLRWYTGYSTGFFSREFAFRVMGITNIDVPSDKTDLEWLLPIVESKYGLQAARLIRDVAAYDKWYASVAPDNRHLQNVTGKADYKIMLQSRDKKSVKVVTGNIVWPFAYRKDDRDVTIDHLPSGGHVWTCKTVRGSIRLQDAMETAHEICEKLAQIAPAYDFPSQDDLRNMREYLADV